MCSRQFAITIAKGRFSYRGTPQLGIAVFRTPQHPNRVERDRIPKSRFETLHFDRNAVIRFRNHLRKCANAWCREQRGKVLGRHARNGVLKRRCPAVEIIYPHFVGARAQDPLRAVYFGRYGTAHHHDRNVRGLGTGSGQGVQRVKIRSRCRCAAGRKHGKRRQR